jgi:hypothetical protein
MKNWRNIITDNLLRTEPLISLLLAPITRKRVTPNIKDAFSRARPASAFDLQTEDSTGAWMTLAELKHTQRYPTDFTDNTDKK